MEVLILKQGYDIRNKSSNGKDKSVTFVQFLKQSFETDIFAAQEVSQFVSELINEQKIYPFQHRIEGIGAVIYSKFSNCHYWSNRFQNKN